jgi:hypothetical protein
VEPNEHRRAAKRSFMPHFYGRLMAWQNLKPGFWIYIIIIKISKGRLVGRSASGRK